MKLSELNEAELTAGIEKILTSTTEFLGLELEYDYSIESYTNTAGEDREILKLSLKGEQDALLIGYHGRTLEQLQNIVSLSLANQFKQIVRVVIDINDYRAKKTSTLENLARRAAQQVEETGQEMELEPMSPAERRIVHNILSEEGNVETESIGEGKERRIMIKPKTLI